MLGAAGEAAGRRLNDAGDKIFEDCVLVDTTHIGGGGRIPRTSVQSIMRVRLSGRRIFGPGQARWGRTVTSGDQVLNASDASRRCLFGGCRSRILFGGAERR